jgi:hypothetical protein
MHPRVYQEQLRTILSTSSAASIALPQNVSPVAATLQRTKLKQIVRRAYKRLRPLKRLNF